MAVLKRKAITKVEI